MREIKFRGKAVMAKVELDYHDIPNYKGWIKGSLIVDGGSYYIVGNIVEASEDGLIHEWWANVHPESATQYTGLKDRNGKEIYDADIIKSKNNQIGYVYWDGVQMTYLVYWFKGEGVSKDYDSYLYNCSKDEIIGNIYEHPHLLKE